MNSRYPWDKEVSNLPQWTRLCDLSIMLFYVKLVDPPGFEPKLPASKAGELPIILWVNDFSFLLVEAVGFEPTLQSPEPCVLTKLYYASLLFYIFRVGTEIRTRTEGVTGPHATVTSSRPYKMGLKGFEPLVDWLKASCSNLTKPQTHTFFLVSF